MKIVAQNCLTKEYLTEQGTWDAAPAKAKIFDSSLKAYEHCRRNNIPHAEVVLKFNGPQFDVTLPVSETCKEQQQRRTR